MRQKFLIISIMVALLLCGGAFAYAWSTASTEIGAAASGGNLATAEAALDQPDWESVLPATVAVETLRPNAAGDITDIFKQFPNSGEHWDKVAEAEADDFSTYVYTNKTDYERDLYNIADSSVGTGTINRVTVYFRFSGEDDGGVGYAKALVKTYGAIYQGSEETQIGKTFDTRSYEWTTNPNTGVAWTWTEINALQIGIDLKISGKYAYCTQVYAEVEYETGAAPEIRGEVPTGDLFLITPNANYTGDLLVKVYLTNVDALKKAYVYLNIKLYLEDSAEASQTPSYQLLALDNGVATFNLDNYAGVTKTLSVLGGSYSVISDNFYDWAQGWSVTPEFYCRVTQR